MINTLPETSDRLVCLEFTGKVTSSDYDPVLDDLTRRLDDRETLDLYVEINDISGWEPSALLKDAKFDIKHANHFRRIAMVGDSKWEEMMTKAIKPFTKAEVRFFPEHQSDQALAWVRC